MIYVKLAFQELFLLRLYEHAQFVDQNLAFFGRDKSGGLNGINQQFDLCCVKVTGTDKILILHFTVNDDVQTELDKLVYVGLNSAGIRTGQAIGFQKVFDLFQRYCIFLARIHPQVLENQECSVFSCHSRLPTFHRVFFVRKDTVSGLWVLNLHYPAKAR